MTLLRIAMTALVATTLALVACAPTALRELPLSDACAAGEVVQVPDARLREVILRQAAKPVDAAVTCDDLARVTLIVSHGISDLRGLEFAANLIRVRIDGGGDIDSLAPLRGARLLASVSLPGQRISDLTPLAGKEALYEVALANNRVRDLAPIAGLPKLFKLDLRGNEVEDLTVLSGLPRLAFLDVSENRIADPAALTAFPSLSTLRVAGNRIEDPSFLADLDVATVDVSYNLIRDGRALVRALDLPTLRMSVDLRYNCLALDSGDPWVEVLVLQRQLVRVRPQRACGADARVSPEPRLTLT